uniref:7-cyano-7-deazaguanine synthase n=1 Tax=Marinobacter sp. TaxID=50741 RepID=UPI0035C6EAB0
NAILVKTPLIHLTKAEIILLGQENGVDFSKTVSCYQITRAGRSCGVCDACRLRMQAFKEVQIEDTIDYV